MLLRLSLIVLLTLGFNAADDDGLLELKNAKFEGGAGDADSNFGKAHGGSYASASAGAKFEGGAGGADWNFGGAHAGSYASASAGAGFAAGGSFSSSGGLLGSLTSGGSYTKSLAGEKKFESIKVENHESSDDSGAAGTINSKEFTSSKEISGGVTNENGDSGAYGAGGVGAGFSAGASFGGGSYGGSASGEKEVELIKGGEASGSFSAAFKSHKIAPVASFSKSIHVVKQPVAVGVVEVAQTQPVGVGVVHVATAVAPHPPPPEPKPVTTVIQKTIIPNYEKKIIKVDSYEEKVVRVPTVIEKEVWVPAAPTIIEKEIKVEQPPPQPLPPVVVPTVAAVPVFYKTKFRKHPFSFGKHFSIGGGFGGGYSGAGYNAGGYSGTGYSGSGYSGSGYSGSGYSGTGYSGGYSAEGAGNTGLAGTFSATVQKRPQLYDDIFNIPVATLGAVNRLVSGIASGHSAEGSVGFSKSFSASKAFSASGSAGAYH